MPAREPQIHHNRATVDLDPELPGFMLDLRPIFETYSATPAGLTRGAPNPERCSGFVSQSHYMILGHKGQIFHAARASASGWTIITVRMAAPWVASELLPRLQTLPLSRRHGLV